MFRAALPLNPVPSAAGPNLCLGILIDKTACGISGSYAARSSKDNRNFKELHYDIVSGCAAVAPATAVLRDHEVYIASGSFQSNY